MKHIVNVTVLGLFFWVMMAVGGSAWASEESTAQPATGILAFEDIEVFQNPNSLVIDLIFKQRVVRVPRSFTWHNPAKLILVFPKLRNAAQKDRYHFDSGDLKSILVADIKDQTRLIFDLYALEQYHIVPVGTRLKVFLYRKGAMLGNVLAEEAGRVARQKEARIAELSSEPSAMQPYSEQSLAKIEAAVPPPIKPSIVQRDQAQAAKKREVQAKQEIENKKLLLRLSPTFSQERLLTAVDFKVGDKNEGQILLDLSAEDVSIDVSRDGDRLVAQLPDLVLPRYLQKQFDVSDFSTLVKSFSLKRQGKGVLLEAMVKGGTWEFISYQAGKRLVVGVIPVRRTTSLGFGSEKEGYTGEKLSLNFQSIEVRTVLQILADFTGLNVITSDSVKGDVTLRLKDVPWDQALDIILESNGLAMRRNADVIYIAPEEELAARQKQELEAINEVNELEPLQTAALHLSYQKAQVFSTMISNEKQGLLSKRGSAVVDTRTNTVFVQDIPQRIEELKRFVRVIDVPVKQVMIEARIVEARDSFSKTLGARLGVNQPPYTTTLAGGGTVSVPSLGSASASQGFGAGIGGGRGILGGSLEQTGFSTAQSVDQPDFSDTFGVNLPASSLNSSQAGRFSLTLFNNAATKFLNLELSALEADGDGKIVSSPRVVTADKNEALIETGTEIPFQQSGALGTVSTSFRKANLSLKVLPSITPEGNIIMDIEITKDSVGSVLTSGGVTIDTKRVKTQVLVQNGGTVAIGGIYSREESKDEVKIPLVGDIPFVGRLFRNESKRYLKSELLVFITPKVVEDNF